MLTYAGGCVSRRPVNRNRDSVVIASEFFHLNRYGSDCTAIKVLNDSGAFSMLRTLSDGMLYHRHLRTRPAVAPRSPTPPAGTTYKT